MGLKLAVLFVTYVSSACGCGERQVHSRGLMMGGELVSPGYFPWHVALYRRPFNGVPAFICGGTLINSNTVITAGHCTYTREGRVVDSSLLTVHLGKTMLENDARTKIVGVSRIQVHAYFDRDTLKHDIAKLMLDETVTYNTYIQPICLWNSNQADLSYVQDKIGTVVGWGFTEKAAKPSNDLLMGSMPVANWSNCLDSHRDFFGQHLTDYNYCAGFRNGTSACSGDSGGGMYFQVNDKWTLRGIVSGVAPREDQFPCSSFDYVLFTDVAKYGSWVVNPLSTSECGRWVPRPGLLTQSVPTAEQGDFPWVASVNQMVNDTKTFRCTGFLVNENTVLTAAECLVDFYGKYMPASDIIVNVGTINTLKTWGQAHSVSKRYRYGSFAAIILKVRVTFSDVIQPICIPYDSTGYDTVDAAYLISWQYYGGTYVREMKISSKLCQNRGDCKKFFKTIAFGNYSPFCDKYANVKSPCWSSGGGLVALKYGTWHLIGVIYTEEDPLKASWDNMQPTKIAELSIDSKTMRDSGWFSQ